MECHPWVHGFIKEQFRKNQMLESASFVFTKICFVNIILGMVDGYGK